MRSIEKSKVMLTSEEYRCYQIAKRYRRRFLFSQIYSVHRIVWPKLLSRVSWSSTGWRFSLQLVLLLVLWPFIAVWGAVEYAFVLLRFPWALLETNKVGRNLRSPGEKSLVGIHTAFQNIVKLPDALYVQCVDEWLIELFGESLCGKSLAEYVRLEGVRQRNVDPVEHQLAAQMRSKVAVAREALSQDLGHYLCQQR